MIDVWCIRRLEILLIFLRSLEVRNKYIFFIMRFKGGLRLFLCFKISNIKILFNVKFSNINIFIENFFKNFFVVFFFLYIE